MKRKLSKSISILLSAVMCINAAPVFAASVGSDASDISVGYDAVQGAKTEYSIDSSKTDVYLTVDGEGVVVSVPTSIIVDGNYDMNGKHTGYYRVSAFGDMTGNEILQIYPSQNNIKVHQTGKSDVDAVIFQDKTEFIYSDVSNTAVSDGKVETENLSAGSWSSDFVFNIQMVKINSFYSSLNLAVDDINGGSVGTKDTLADLFTAENAVCGVYKAADGYQIEVFEDIPSQTSVIIQENADIDLNNHSINFANNNYLTYTKDFSVHDGTVVAANAPYVIFSDENNADSTLNIQNVDITTNITSSITTDVCAVDVWSANVRCNNLTINQSGKGVSSRNVSGIMTRNTANNSSTVLDNFVYNADVQGCNRIRGARIDGNAILNNPDMTINNANSAAQAIACPSTATLTVDGAHIVMGSDTTKSVFGIFSQAAKTIVKNGNIYVDDANLNGAGLNLTSTVTDQYTSIEDCVIYGKEWAVVTPTSGKTEIRNTSFSSTDHTGYICGNTDVYDCEFYIANCAGQIVKDSPFGLYLGSPKALDDYTVNFTRCKINNGKERADYAVTAKSKDNYISPTNVNFYDCEIYRTVLASTGDPGHVFSYNYTFKNWPGRTKFNLYDNTKLIDDNGTEITKDVFDSWNATWKSTPSFHKSTGLYSEFQIGNALAGGFIGNINPDTGVINAVYLTDDAGIYDYR